jgi:hypothetical protein
VTIQLTKGHWAALVQKLIFYQYIFDNIRSIGLLKTTARLPHLMIDARTCGVFIIFLVVALVHTVAICTSVIIMDTTVINHILSATDKICDILLN